MRRQAWTIAAVLLLSGGAGFLLQTVVAQDHQHAPAPAAKAGQPAAKTSSAKPTPHPQATLPPLTLPSYTLPRPPEVVRAAYKFAAEHPEILTYMPCFCGCDQSGHRGNEDCFVKTRAKNGDVTEWNDHGMVCGMCLAVAEQSMRMAAAGSTIPEIRAEVERKFGNITGSRTPTPPPPTR